MKPYDQYSPLVCGWVVTEEQLDQIAIDNEYPGDTPAERAFGTLQHLAFAGDAGCPMDYVTIRVRNRIFEFIAIAARNLRGNGVLLPHDPDPASYAQLQALLGQTEKRPKWYYKS